MFQVPDSSSPPATPEAKRDKSTSFFQQSHPSTTPLGPPPSDFSKLSTTPSGPPPSSVFGSNPYGSSFQQPTPSRLHNNATRGSPLKFNASRNSLQSFDAMDEDHDMDDFRVSIHGKEELDGVDIPGIARSIASRPAPLREPDDVVLATDQVIEQLYTNAAEAEARGDGWDDAIPQASQQLLQVWKRRPDRNVSTSGIGPGAAATDMSSAIFLVSLLLPLHHPSPAIPASMRHSGGQGTNQAPVPEVLITWLRDYHDPFPDEYSEVMRSQDGPAASERFWDVCFAQSVRGNMRELCQLLKEADFAQAYTALDDGAEQPGYEGQQLVNVQKVVNRARTVIESCPALSYGDWDVRGNAWATYRKRIQQQRRELETFAEGNLTDDGPNLPDDFGFSTTRRSDFNMSQMSRRAQSKVPWSIYENLKQLYNQILGFSEEISAACGDWLEATIAMAIWWPGDEVSSESNFRQSGRKSLAMSKHHESTTGRPLSGYQEKLLISFRHVTSTTDEAELQVNTTDVVQVGLGCIFEGDIEGLLAILKGWSATISNAVVEVGNFGQWLNKSPSPSKSLMRGFDKSDLMVLSVAQHDSSGIDFDEELIRYANLLNGRPVFRGQRQGDEIEGWQLAVQVLSRLRNDEVANQHITTIIGNLEFDKSRVDKATNLCRELDMLQLARSISERYADELANSTSKYGDALIYYARAQDLKKVKDVLNLLISSSLVQSCAYPPESALDPVLKSIVSSPGTTLSSLQHVDGPAAEMLASHVSGYACLRRYYDLRDGATASSGMKQALRPLARRRAAATALIAVIMSAADSIHGGLYDDEIQSVIPIDGLHVLLGEALMFVNQESRILSTSQIFALLKAIEDISTVTPMVASQCERGFRSALAAAKGASVPSPQQLLKQSTTDGLGSGSSSSFSLINMVSNDSQSNGSLEGSGVLVNGHESGEDTVKRGWDWRSGFEKGAKAEDMLLLLRLGLAREVSNAWTDVNS